MQLYAITLTVLLFAAQAFAQCVHRNDIVLNKQQRPVAGAKIYLCAQPALGQPCSNKVKIYTDLSCTVEKQQPVITDSNGNWDVYAKSGWVTLETIYGYNVFPPYPDYGLFAVGLPITKTLVLTAPVLTDSAVYQFKFGVPVGLVQFDCDTDQGTVTANLEIRSIPNQAGPAVLSAPIYCSSTGSTTATFAVSDVPRNASVALIITNVADFPGVLRTNISAQAQ